MTTASPAVRVHASATTRGVAKAALAFACCLAASACASQDRIGAPPVQSSGEGPSAPEESQNDVAAAANDTASGNSTEGAPVASDGEPGETTHSGEVAVVRDGDPRSGDLPLLRRANAVSGWAAKRRGELEACAGGMSLARAVLVIEIAEDGTVTHGHLSGVDASVESASRACVRDVATRLRFVASEAGAGGQTLDVPLAGR